jgi:hypothetical protein
MKMYFSARGILKISVIIKDSVENSSSCFVNKYVYARLDNGPTKYLKEF